MSRPAVAKIVKKWPTVPELANDLSEYLGRYVSQSTVRSWHSMYGKIRETYWEALIASAKKRGIKGVTVESLYEANK